MKELAQLLKEHFDNHPDMEPRDAMKFLYQSHMGGGHLIQDEAASLRHLQEEWAQVNPDPAAPLLTPLGNGLYRLHLCPCKGIGLSPSTINRLFYLTAQGIAVNPSRLVASFPLLDALPFSKTLVQDELARYRSQGCPMLSHSQTYRQAYAPAYRIISTPYARLLPLLGTIDRRMQAHPRVLLGIDGPCASGKSTVGRLLAQIYRCSLLSMDDFFLRPEQRIPSRLSEPGGNVDYERFEREVLSSLRRGKVACYRPWQCRQGQFGSAVTAAPGPLTITEGSYSLHPALRKSYQLRIWVQAPWPLRYRRLLRREGQDGAKNFVQRWIPLEERYFAACQVKQDCQLWLSGRGLR